LRPRMRTSFHHQPEAQHPKSPAIYTPAGRLPHLLALSGQSSRTRICPLSGNSGQRWILACDGLSAYDPKRTIAVHCGNGFDVGFSPYQSTRLSRYNPVP